MNKKIDLTISALALGAAIACIVVCEGSRLAWTCCCLWIIKSMVLVATENS